MKRFLLVVVGAVAIATAIWFFGFNDQAQAPGQSNDSQNKSQNEDSQDFDKTANSIDDTDSIWLIVNKDRPISLEYSPSDLVDVNVDKRTDKSDAELQLRSESAKALESLFAEAKIQNISLLLGSAYRSADLQATYYNNYVANYGQEEADRFSAKPGTSEHQTGLSADLSGTDKVCYLEICFAETAEGKWLAENAHTFGFIIRYPDDKEEITGYQYEPWHIRFVGVDLATELKNSGQTMEEFFEL